MNNNAKNKLNKNEYLLRLVLNDSLKLNDNTKNTDLINIVCQYAFDEELDNCFTFFQKIEYDAQKKMISIVANALRGFNYDKELKELKSLVANVLNNEFQFFVKYINSKALSVKKYNEIKGKVNFNNTYIKELKNCINNLDPKLDLTGFENNAQQAIIDMATFSFNILKKDICSLFELHSMFYNYLDERYDKLGFRLSYYIFCKPEELKKSLNLW